MPSKALLEERIKTLEKELLDLQKSASEKDQILNLSCDLICIADNEGHFKYVNPAWEKMLGYSSDEMLSQPLSNFIHPDDHGKSKKEVGRLLKGLNMVNSENRYIHKNGSVLTISWTAIPDVEKGLFYCIGRDVTEARSTEAALKENEERFRALIENTSDWIWELDTQGVFTYCSPNVQELTGYRPDELIGQTPLPIMPPDETKRIKVIFQRNVREKSSFNNLENRIIHKKGHEVILESSGVPVVDTQGNLLGFRGINRDITDRKHAEKIIQKSLDEKEILLREIHHRVKNNLQIIISLLNLQSYRINDPDAKQAFENSKQRVYSMALVHEKLYRSKNFANIRFNDYVRTMTAEILRASAGISEIDMDIQVEPIEVSIDLAIPFGLIINELITNSIKYAFPDKRKGAVRIEFKAIENQYRLTVADNGIGLPDEVYFQKKGSLGMQLVHVLTEQIGGSIEIHRKGGTRFTINIDIPK